MPLYGEDMSRSPLSRVFARLTLRVLGWRVQGKAPKERAYVLIGAPHTTNADFLYFLLVAAAAGIPMRFLAKKSLFKFPFGFVLRALGGIPIDRAKSTDLVGTAAVELHARGGAYALLPKGTRGRRAGWKSGFYHIARTAGVPVVMVSLNYARKQAKVSEPLHLSGDVRADMLRVRAFYADARGRRPELDDVIRLELEDEAAPEPN